MATKIWVNIGSGNGLVAWRHQAITWTNIDLSSGRWCDIHLKTSSQEIPQPSITEIICKIKHLKFHSNFPGANELIVCRRYYPLCNYSLPKPILTKIYDNIWCQSWCWGRKGKVLPHRKQGLIYPKGQYHGCWCPGDKRSQGISTHGIDLIFLEYSSLST